MPRRRSWRKSRTTRRRGVYKRSRKTYPRRTKRYSRRGSKGHLRITNVRARGTTMPDKMYVKLKFFDTFVITYDGTSGPYFRAWSGNSIYIPNPSAGGGGNYNRPIGYTAWNQFYNSYRVTASKITIVCHNQSGSVDGLLSLVPLQLIGTNTSFYGNQPGSQKWVKTRFIPSSAGGKEQKAISYYMTTSKVFTQPMNQLGDKVQANWHNDPAMQWYWHMEWGDIKFGQTDVVPASFSVSIKYYVEVFNPIMPFPNNTT